MQGGFGKMHIAQIAPPWVSVPPKKYGGTELVVSLLTEGLIDRGYEVTLFASGDSKTKGELEYIYKNAVWPPDKYSENNHLAFSIKKCIEKKVDIIHSHLEVGMGFSRFTDIPIVVTLHIPFTEKILDYFKYFKDVHYVSISNFQRSRGPKEMKYSATVYHGIDVSAYPYSNKKEDYVAFLGRLMPVKGVHTAIIIAKETGIPLKIAGVISDKQYFEQVLKPSIDGEMVEYIGEVSFEDKCKLLSKAKALLFPIEWPEPFGLIVAESLACGTPVISYLRGSIPEIIVDGKHGFIVQSREEMAKKLKEVGKISSSDCRKRVKEKFSVDNMVNGYIKVYEEVLTNT
ncbi:MAG TPA: glycosyltransferase family 4 protein [Methanosarcinales archaeon]|nr:glycosyltransferase family 4 protein [Methanosarcinales archaeon]